jgi:histidine triad (HIT) family protein
MTDCVFCRVARKEIPSTVMYEDEKVMVIKDIHPVAPVHLLAIPKDHVLEFRFLENDATCLALKNALQKMIIETGLSDKGYKIEINGGGAQLVDHLHIHLLGPISAPKK